MAAKELQITKSTRHAKICGNFGEATVLYWLSKYGFECALWIIQESTLSPAVRIPRR